MIEYLEKLWNQFICEHEYEISYTEKTEDIDIIHYICINCGKTKIKYGKENN
jgi:hypothetical protein